MKTNKMLFSPAGPSPRSIFLRAAVLAVSLGAMACAHATSDAKYVTGVKIDPAALSTLEIGRATKMDVARRYGAPKLQLPLVNDGQYYDEKCGDRYAPLDGYLYMYSEMQTHGDGAVGFGSGSTNVQTKQHNEITTFIFNATALCKQMTDVRD